MGQRLKMTVTGRPWVDDEEELLARLHVEGHRLDRIALILGRTRRSIKQRIAHRGLRRGNRYATKA